MAHFQQIENAVGRAPQFADSHAARYLAQLASGLLGSKLLPVAQHGILLPDSKQTWILYDGTREPRAVAQLSSTVSPDMVSRGLIRAATIRAAVAPNLGEPILPALASGIFEGASFAIWPFCTPLTEVGPTWLMRRVLTQPVLDWLRELVRQTACRLHDPAFAHIEHCLCAMATNSALGSRARLAARSTLKRLDSGTWRPMQVAMHGDFHGGNMLVDGDDATDRASVSAEQRFVIIDWCGASLQGHPLIDLLRIGDSFRIPASLLATEIATHCALLGGTAEDAVAHTAAALADLGANLEYFPVERYAELADRMFMKLITTLPNTQGALS